MKPVIVFGTGDFADIVSFILEEKLGLSIAAYAVHERFRQEDSYRGRPLVALEECQRRFPPASVDAVLAIIGKKMFTQREAVFSDFVKMGYRIRNVIDPRASLDTDRIGQGNIILAGASIEAHCSIGDGNILWQNVVLPHHNQIGNFNNLAPSVSFSGYSCAGDHCFIGNNVCVKNKVRIPDWCFIGAGAYVSMQLQEGDMVVPEKSKLLAGKSGFDFL